MTNVTVRPGTPFPTKSDVETKQLAPDVVLDIDAIYDKFVKKVHQRWRREVTTVTEKKLAPLFNLIWTMGNDFYWKCLQANRMSCESLKEKVATHFFINAYAGFKIAKVTTVKDAKLFKPQHNQGKAWQMVLQLKTQKFLS